jgi:hypothetical protein
MYRAACTALTVALYLVAADRPASLAEADPHAYFKALTARGDHYKSFSFRPQPGEPITSPNYERQLLGTGSGGYAAGSGGWVTYSPGTDSDPNRQDAAKVTISAFSPVISTVATAVDAATTMIPLTLADSRFENRRAIKIDSEVMVINGARVGNTVPVSRGQHGTAAAPHGVGAEARLSSNSLASQVRLPLNTMDGSTYLFTWDAFWTSSYNGTAMGNHKAFQIASLETGDQWFEVQARYAGPPSTAPNPAWNRATDVAAITGRGYSQYGPTVTDGEPLLPMTSAPFIIKPNRWTRFWVIVEANNEGDPSKFTNTSTLAAGVASPTATTITINHPSTVSNPFTAATSVAGPSWPGRTLRIDSEIMTIVSGPNSGPTRDLVVVRGAHGTTPATHAAGANVQLVHDYATMYMADEGTDPVMLYSRLPMHLPIDHETPSRRGSMSRFWVEFNTSNTALARSDQHDLIAYVRNFVALRNPADVPSLLIRPSGGVPPPYTGPLAAPVAPTSVRILR